MIPWTAACPAPLSMEFSRQEYCSGLPFPSPGDLPNMEIEPRPPTQQADFLPAEPQIRSVAQSCPTLCNPMNHSMPGLPGHHQLPEFTQTHVHRIITFLPRIKRLLISWLQSPSVVILEPRKIKSDCFHCFPIYFP